jgi:hypothetical protein
MTNQKHPNLFFRRMSAGKLPPWDWSDTLVVGTVAFVVLIGMGALLVVLLAG